MNAQTHAEQGNTASAGTNVTDQWHRIQRLVRYCRRRSRADYCARLRDLACRIVRRRVPGGLVRIPRRPIGEGQELLGLCE